MSSLKFAVSGQQIQANNGHLPPHRGHHHRHLGRMYSDQMCNNSARVQREGLTCRDRTTHRQEDLTFRDQMCKDQMCSALVQMCKDQMCSALVQMCKDQMFNAQTLIQQEDLTFKDRMFSVLTLIQQEDRTYSDQMFRDLTFKDQMSHQQEDRMFNVPT
jgi:hypothetical protein